MAHYRKDIRRVLDGMGFKNRFSVHEQKSGHSHEMLVTIEDWMPDPKAYELKRAIEKELHEKVSVCFTGPHVEEKLCLR